MDCVCLTMEISSLRQTLPDKKTSVHLPVEGGCWNVQFHELAKHVKTEDISRLAGAGATQKEPHSSAGKGCTLSTGHGVTESLIHGLLLLLLQFLPGGGMWKVNHVYFSEGLNNKQAQCRRSSSGEAIGFSYRAQVRSYLQGCEGCPQKATPESLASRDVDFPTASQMKPPLVFPVLYTLAFCRDRMQLE